MFEEAGEEEEREKADGMLIFSVSGCVPSRSFTEREVTVEGR